MSNRNYQEDDERYKFRQSYDFSHQAGQLYDLQSRAKELKFQLAETDKQIETIVSSLPAQIQDMWKEDDIVRRLKGEV